MPQVIWSACVCVCEAFCSAYACVCLCVCDPECLCSDLEAVCLGVCFSDGKCLIVCACVMCVCMCVCSSMFLSLLRSATLTDTSVLSCRE